MQAPIHRRAHAYVLWLCHASVLISLNPYSCVSIIVAVPANETPGWLYHVCNLDGACCVQVQ